MLNRILIQVLVACILSHNVVGQTVLSVSDAIDLALQHNFQIAVARIDAEIAANNNHSGNAGMLPSVTFNISETPSLISINQRFTNGTEIIRDNVFSHNFNANMALSYTLFDGGRMYATKRRLEELEVLGKDNLQVQIQSVLSEVIAKYYDILRQQQYLEVLNRLKETGEVQLNLIKTRIDAGLANNTEVYLSQLDLDSRLQNIRQQELSISNAMKELNLLLNLPPTQQYTLVYSELEDKELLRSEMDSAFSNNPVYKVAEHLFEAATLAEREAKASLYPRVTLNGAYGYSLAQSQAGFSLYNQTIGPVGALAISIPLFTGNVNARNYKTARLQLQSADLEKKQAMASLSVSYEKAWDLYNTSVQQLSQDRESKKIAEQYLDLMKQKFELGQCTILEFREAQRTYDESNYRVIVNTYNKKLAETEILRMSGRIAQ